MDMFKDSKENSSSEIKTGTGDTENVINEAINLPKNVRNQLFMFQEPKVKEESKEAQPADSIKKIRLYMGDGVYYTIEIPMDLEIVTDNSSYIYAKDSSVSVSVVSNVPWDDFSKYVAIDNAENITPYLIRSPSGSKKPLEAAMHIVNDKAIIVRTYDNPVGFATILNGLTRNSYQVANSAGMQVSDKSTTVLKELPTYTGYHVTVNIGLADDTQNIYNYKDGNLTVAREFKQWRNANNILSNKLAVISGKNIADKAYVSDTVTYTEAGEYTIAAVSVNFNTTITLFGIGEESRFNIVAFLKGYTTS